MKRILSILLVLAMCLTTCFAAGAVQVPATARAVFTLSADPCYIGENVDVSISLVCPDEINTIAVAGFTYDANVFEFVSFSDYEEPIKSQLALAGMKPDASKQTVTIPLSAARPIDDKLCTMTLKVKENVAPGTYTVSATTTVAKKGSTAVESFLVPAEIVVSEKTAPKLDFTGLAFESDTYVYDGSVKELKLKGDVPEGTSVKYTSDDYDVTAGAINAGTYNVKVTVENEGYNTWSKTATLTIHKAPITITADDITKEIGTADPELTYKVQGTVAAVDTFTGNLERELGEEAGKYAIKIGTLALNNNYDITFITGTFTIVDNTPPVVDVTDVALDKTSATLTVGDTLALTATVSPDNATDKSVTWTSSNPNVASVTTTGVVTAIAEGSATITVATSNGKTDTCEVKVNKATVSVDGVALDKTSATLTVGDTLALTATVSPDNATDKSVTWTSSNPNVASVTTTGVVTAIAEGSATITVATSNGKTDTCEVKVNAPVAQDAPTIKVVNAKGKSGKTVDVVIELANNPGVAYVKFNLGYDSSVMTLQSVTGNDIFADTEFTKGDLNKNPYTVLAAQYAVNKEANGKFVTATFLLKEDCAEGNYEITLTNPEAYDIDLNDVAINLENGIITVKNIDPGDVTGDGIINGKDLMLLGKSLAGWDVTVDETGADVTGDGVVNGKDLMLLGKFLAGWDVQLGK